WFTISPPLSSQQVRNDYALPPSNAATYYSIVEIPAGFLTQDRDMEIRSILIYGSSGQQGHMWIDPFDEKETVGVHAASDGFRLDRSVPLSDLASVLSEVYDALARQVRPEDYLK